MNLEFIVCLSFSLIFQFAIFILFSVTFGLVFVKPSLDATDSMVLFGI